ncbi:MAG TPA: 16S rRNA (uracil(1498)-N(3))-methyltransferase, partial [Burkholderiales bacterium]|nr:16S rRNA (uracil(1498)-N(3))-methyltransferase [Burkholderiales bacterium]
MRIPRFHVAEGVRPGARIDLPDEAAHHALRVLRLGDGDPLTLFDGRGGEYEARIVTVTRGGVAVEIGEHRARECESPLSITLVQGLSSSDRMDFIIQKAVELGVAAIQPVLTAKSVVRLSKDRSAAKLAHWQRVAIAACEQCGRNRIPEIRAALPISQYAPNDASVKIVLSPLATKDLKQLVQSPLTLAVGPEAG